MDNAGWREYFAERELVEKAALIAWPDAEIEWCYDGHGYVSIDHSAYHWNPIYDPRSAHNLALRLKRDKYIELFKDHVDSAEMSLLRKEFVKRVVEGKLDV